MSVREEHIEEFLTLINDNEGQGMEFVIGWWDIGWSFTTRMRQEGYSLNEVANSINRKPLYIRKRLDIINMWDLKTSYETLVRQHTITSWTQLELFLYPNRDPRKGRTVGAMPNSRLDSLVERGATVASIKRIVEAVTAALPDSAFLSTRDMPAGVLYQVGIGNLNVQL